MKGKEGTIMTTLRIPHELHGKLELIRSAVQYREGRRVTLNELMVSILAAQVRDVEEHNPGTFQHGGIDVSFMLGSSLTE